MEIAGLSVGDLMQPNVSTVTGNTTLQTAAKMMQQGNVSSLVIAPADERDAWGIITRKDVVEELVSLEADDTSLLVEDVMTKPAITVHPGLSIGHCLQLMRMVGVRRMPVVDGAELVGILSNTDVFRHLARSLQEADKNGG